MLKIFSSTSSTSASCSSSSSSSRLRVRSSSCTPSTLLPSFSSFSISVNVSSDPELLNFKQRLHNTLLRCEQNRTPSKLLEKIDHGNYQIFLNTLIESNQYFAGISPLHSRCLIFQQGPHRREVTIARDMGGIFRCILHATVQDRKNFYATANEKNCSGKQKKEGSPGAWQLDSEPEKPLWQAFYSYPCKEIRNKGRKCFVKDEDNLYRPGNIKEVQLSQTFNSSYLLVYYAGVERIINNTSVQPVFSELGDYDLLTCLETLQKSGFAPSSTLKDQWTMDMLLAVRFFHNNKLIHSDLSLQNFVCFGNRVKLSDFSLVYPINGEMQGGNPEYVPPEFCVNTFDRSIPLILTMAYKLSRDKFEEIGKYVKYLSETTKGDMWALGIALYFMEEGDYPPKDAYKKINKGYPNNLIAKLLALNPKKRPDIDQAILIHRKACAKRKSFPLEHYSVTKINPNFYNLSLWVKRLGAIHQELGNLQNQSTDHRFPSPPENSKSLVIHSKKKPEIPDNKSNFVPVISTRIKIGGI